VEEFEEMHSIETATASRSGSVSLALLCIVDVKPFSSLGLYGYSLYLVLSLSGVVSDIFLDQLVST
jgi:hypothetical protein